MPGLTHSPATASGADTSITGAPAVPAATSERWLRAAERRLHAAGVTSARLDARVLLAEVLRIDPATLAFGSDRILDGKMSVHAEALLRRRERREPVSRILGRREFWSLEFMLSAETLDPRPGSETLIELALRLFANRTAPLRVLDLGTGSGCLL